MRTITLNEHQNRALCEWKTSAYARKAEKVIRAKNALKDAIKSA